MDEARSKKGEGRISRGTIKGREKGELAEARSKRREKGEGRISQGSSSLDHETISRDDATPHPRRMLHPTKIGESSREVGIALCIYDNKFTFLDVLLRYGLILL